MCVQVQARVCVSACIRMYTRKKNLDGSINPTVVLVSYLVHKTTVKHPVISMPDTLTDIQISNIFDSTFKIGTFRKVHLTVCKDLVHILDQLRSECSII